ncbi:uncharacterized protein LOC112502138 [Cynara cardunculus var. scolymus]|uniref:Uncharacterized protein n=1 Tax=Cynara cardunculus var. scolymus TaxID=59895 RepID=A0A124SAS4_CYNCS|nr:uncharacterized protein LOC112502138 [Cynara cardunculus var. scolymus]KVH88420.1 hypothetical protein Ccrd_026846 [Cynara cardunculus var. scolymus]
MSASTSRAVVSRLCSRFSIKLFNGKPLKSSSSNPSLKRISATSRLPVQLCSLLSMMPLHSAVASSRLTSALSAESQSWGLIPLGISMPL